MSGLSDYFAENMLNYLSGAKAMPALPAVYLALYTTAPTADAGTGGTEVTGGAYARVQVAGTATTNASTATSSATLNFASTPTWIVAGMRALDITTPTAITGGQTVLSTTGSTVVLSADVNVAVASSDVIAFSAFTAGSASSGNEPATSPSSINNNAAITFPQATLSWGTVTSFGLYDASTSGDLLAWDYLGNFKWIPFSCTSASPGVLTTDATADAPANSSSVVVTQKYGGTLPTTGGSFAGILTTAGLSGATFNVGVNTTSIGGGQFRQVTQQSIPANVTASFAASALTITSA